jgi:hypothetical protein
LQQVDLEQFLRDASFGPVRLGMSFDEVVAVVGAPDFIETRRRTNLTAAHYGHIEFYFDHLQEKRLVTIYSDHFHELDGGSALQFEPWILRGQVSQAVVEEELRLNDIRFAQAQSPSPELTSIKTEGGVELYFGVVAEGENWPGLYSICVSSGLAENDPGRQVSVTLTRGDYEIIRRIAKKEGIGISKLCSRWIAEKVKLLGE